MSQDFYVIRELNRNMILSLDWLKDKNVRIYMDLKGIRINGKHYLNLEEDIHIASTVIMKHTCLIKPKTAVICYGRLGRIQIYLWDNLMKFLKLIRVLL